MFSNLPWLLHYSLVSDYLCTYHPNQNRPVKDYLFQLSSCHLHYLRGNLTGSLHCTLPYYVGWVQWSPHVVVSIGPKEISINPSPYIAPQGQIQLGLWQSLLSLPESVQSAGSPDSLPSGLRKWNSSEWNGVRIWPLELLQPFCSHEGTQLTIKPMYCRGTANIISDNKIQTLMKVYMKITLKKKKDRSTFGLLVTWSNKFPLF